MVIQAYKRHQYQKVAGRGLRASSGLGHQLSYDATGCGDLGETNKTERL